MRPSHAAQAISVEGSGLVARMSSRCMPIARPSSSRICQCGLPWPYSLSAMTSWLHAFKILIRVSQSGQLVATLQLQHRIALARVETMLLDEAAGAARRQLFLLKTVALAIGVDRLVPSVAIPSSRSCRILPGPVCLRVAPGCPPWQDRPWPRRWGTCRNGRSRRQAPRSHGRRGCLRPDGRALPTPPEAITGIAHRIGDRAGQRDVEARLGAVAIHRGQQNFAGAEAAMRCAHSTASMPVGVAPAMGEDLPASRRRSAWRRSRRRCIGCRISRPPRARIRGAPRRRC